MRKEKTPTQFSLLYPTGHQPSAQPHFIKNTPEDLGVDVIARELAYDRQDEKMVRNILLELNTDLSVINYRQEILQDVLTNPGIFQGLTDVIGVLGRLQRYNQPGSVRLEESIRQTLDRLMELGLYIECVDRLQQVLSLPENKLASNGLKQLGEYLSGLINDPTYQSLKKNIPELVKKLRETPSITVGINLDIELRPMEVILLSVNNKPFRESSLLSRLMGNSENRNPEEGIGPIHAVPFEPMDNIYGKVLSSDKRSDPMLVPLFQDVYKVLKAAFQPVSKQLQAYSQFRTGLILSLEKEISFYLGAVLTIQRLQRQGLATCRPTALPMADREMHLEGMYNLLLALRFIADGKDTTQIVFNEADFDENGRIYLLTGPNQGGKTVFTQGVGIAQMLFQAGLFVPANEASLSPVDGLFTHFASEEEFNASHGRLSEESMRLNEIFRHATRHSLVLLNETLSSTSAADSMYLSRDIVRALRAFGARAIFATHLHELAEEAAAFNTELAGDSKVESLVAGVDLTDEELLAEQSKFVARTYQIKKGPPRGLSFARGIAHKNGISYDQLFAIKQERGV